MDSRGVIHHPHEMFRHVMFSGGCHEMFRDVMFSGGCHDMFRDVMFSGGWQTLSLQRSSAEALVTQVLQSEGPVVILLLSQFH